jgi:hypothetical protein
MNWHIIAALFGMLCFFSGETWAGADLLTLQSCAPKGDAYCQWDLADRYIHGRGVPQDYAEAALWYRKSAEQGQKNSQLDLAILYLDGCGVPQSAEEAVKWMRKAANQGHTPAQGRLADLYFIGLGVPQSYTESYFWYTVAGKFGYVFEDKKCLLGKIDIQRGQQRLEEIVMHLTATQARDVATRADAWKRSEAASEHRRNEWYKIKRFFSNPYSIAFWPPFLLFVGLLAYLLRSSQQKLVPHIAQSAAAAFVFANIIGFIAVTYGIVLFMGIILIIFVGLGCVFMIAAADVLLIISFLPTVRKIGTEDLQKFAMIVGVFGTTCIATWFLEIMALRMFHSLMS